MHLDISDVAHPYKTILEKNVSSFDRALKDAYTIGQAVDFSDDLAMFLYLTHSEIDKIPKDQLIKWEDREKVFKKKSSWIIIMNLKGLILCEFIKNGDRYDYIDYFDYKNNEIEKGDIVHVRLNKKFCLATERLDRAFNYQYLFDPDGSLMDGLYCEYIPMYYIDKVSEQEEKQLHLKEIFDKLYKNFIENEGSRHTKVFCDAFAKYPWL